MSETNRTSAPRSRTTRRAQARHELSFTQSGDLLIIRIHGGKPRRAARAAILNSIRTLGAFGSFGPILDTTHYTAADLKTSVLLVPAVTEAELTEAASLARTAGWTVRRPVIHV